MKMSRKILVITVCLLVLLSISLVSFAIPTSRLRQLISGNSGGYYYAGYGSISGKLATASLLLSPLENQVHIPPEDCQSSITMNIWNHDGIRLNDVTYYGSTRVTARFEAEEEIYRVDLTYRFMSTELGVRTVYCS